MGSLDPPASLAQARLRTEDVRLARVLHDGVANQNLERMHQQSLFVTVLHAVNDSNVHFSDVCVLVGEQKIVQANTSFLSLVQNQAIVF